MLAIHSTVYSWDLHHECSFRFDFECVMLFIKFSQNVITQRRKVISGFLFYSPHWWHQVTFPTWFSKVSITAIKTPSWLSTNPAFKCWVKKAVHALSIPPNVLTKKHVVFPSSVLVVILLITPAWIGLLHSQAIHLKSKI